DPGAGRPDRRLAEGQPGGPRRPRGGLTPAGARPPERGPGRPTATARTAAGPCRGPAAPPPRGRGRSRRRGDPAGPPCHRPVGGAAPAAGVRPHLARAVQSGRPITTAVPVLPRRPPLTPDLRRGGVRTRRARAGPARADGTG